MKSRFGFVAGLGLSLLVAFAGCKNNDPRIGQIAYSDGTFSAAYDSTKTPIGIVFDAKKNNVKIVGLQEGSNLAWAVSDKPDYTFNVSAEGFGLKIKTSKSDGSKNLQAIYDAVEPFVGKEVKDQLSADIEQIKNDEYETQKKRYNKLKKTGKAGKAPKMSKIAEDKKVKAKILQKQLDAYESLFERYGMHLGKEVKDEIKKEIEQTAEGKAKLAELDLDVYKDQVPGFMKEGKYPALEYGVAYAAGDKTWYLPAKDELKALYNNRVKVQLALERMMIGGYSDVDLLINVCDEAREWLIQDKKDEIAKNFVTDEGKVTPVRLNEVVERKTEGFFQEEFKKAKRETVSKYEKEIVFKELVERESTASSKIILDKIDSKISQKLQEVENNKSKYDKMVKLIADAKDPKAAIRRYENEVKKAGDKLASFQKKSADVVKYLEENEKVEDSDMMKKITDLIDEDDVKAILAEAYENEDVDVEAKKAEIASYTLDQLFAELGEKCGKNGVNAIKAKISSAEEALTKTLSAKSSEKDEAESVISKAKNIKKSEKVKKEYEDVLDKSRGEKAAMDKARDEVAKYFKTVSPVVESTEIMDKILEVLTLSDVQEMVIDSYGKEIDVTEGDALKDLILAEISTSELQRILCDSWEEEINKYEDKLVLKLVSDLKGAEYEKWSDEDKAAWENGNRKCDGKIYWSSSQYSGNRYDAHYINFGSGFKSDWYKNTGNFARAVAKN